MIGEVRETQDQLKGLQAVSYSNEKVISRYDVGENVELWS